MHACARSRPRRGRAGAGQVSRCSATRRTSRGILRIPVRVLGLQLWGAGVMCFAALEGTEEWEWGVGERHVATRRLSSKFGGLEIERTLVPLLQLLLVKVRRLLQLD